MSDGTAAGTVLVKDLRPGIDSSAPSGLTAAGDRLYFSAIDPVAGREPFVSDGTAAGTVLLRDIDPAADSNPQAFGALDTGDYVMFAATEPGTGSEAWLSDGTPAGTVRVGDLEPGPGSSSPSGFTRLGTRALMAATESSVGRELFAVDLVPFGVPLADAYGSGCPGTAGVVPTLSAVGLPRQGAAGFAVRIDQARPQSIGALLLSMQRAAFPLSGCTLLVGPWVPVAIRTDARGSVQLPLPVPTGSAGVAIDLQAVINDPYGGFFRAASGTPGLALLIGS